MCLQFSSGDKMTLFKVIAVTMLSLFLMTKQSKGQFAEPLVMDPNEDDIVLDAGATLNLTCTFTVLAVDSLNELNISWKLSDHLEKDKLVRNIRTVFCLQL